MQMLLQEDVSLPRVSGLLETDAALATEVLRAANSPLLWLGTEVKRIPAAVTKLGLNRLGLLVATTALWRMIPGSVKNGFVRAWWRHNLACALVCRELADAGCASEYGYIAGLLHSVGQLAFIGMYPVEYSALLARAAAAGRTVRDCEREWMGADHCELGSALLRKWGIPEEIAACAAHHHDPENSASPLAELACAACLVANRLGFASGPGYELPDWRLPQVAEDFLADEALCASTADSVRWLESSLQ